MTRRDHIAVVVLIVVTTTVSVMSQMLQAPGLQLIGSTVMLVFLAVLFYRKIVKPNTRKGRRDFR